MTNATANKPAEELQGQSDAEIPAPRPIVNWSAPKSTTAKKYAPVLSLVGRTIYVFDTATAPRVQREGKPTPKPFYLMIWGMKPEPPTEIKPENLAEISEGAYNRFNTVLAQESKPIIHVTVSKGKRAAIFGSPSAPLEDSAPSE